KRPPKILMHPLAVPMSWRGWPGRARAGPGAYETGMERPSLRLRQRPAGECGPGPSRLRAGFRRRPPAPAGGGRPPLARVANFYAPQSIGHTPSGTGTAARVAVLRRGEQILAGVDYFHEIPVGLKGSATMKAAPSPGRLWTEMVPPCRSTIFLAMARPSPLPPAARWRDLSAL